MTTSVVAEILAAAARAQREAEPTFGMIQLAREAAELGETECALQIANVATPKEDATWFAFLATLHAMLGNAVEVERLTVKALEDPSSTGYRRLAEAYTRLGDPERADRYIGLVAETSLWSAIAANITLSLEMGDLGRATKLADRPGFSEEDPWRLLGIEVEISRAFAEKGNHLAARQWLDRATERLEADDRTTALEIAIIASKIGDKARALDLIRRVDKATYNKKRPYVTFESLDLARAYDAAGETVKVDEILHAYAAAEDERGNASGYAEAAKAYLKFGRELGVRKRLAAAEAALTGPADTAHATVASAYALDRQFVQALQHTAFLSDPDMRVQRLVEIARGIHAAKPEPTPELVEAVGKLP